MDLTKRVEYLSEDLTEVFFTLEKAKCIANNLHVEFCTRDDLKNEELMLARIENDRIMMSVVADYIDKAFDTVKRLDNEVEQWNLSLQNQQQDE